MIGRLLVVDDDEASRRLIDVTFSAEGLDVIDASDGPAGIERVAKDRPDVVLLDVHLPGMDGLEVLQRVKAGYPLLPVVMLTASDDVKTAVRAIQLGAVDYLTKPIDRDQVIVAVRRALEVRALKVEVEELRRRVIEGAADTLGVQMGSSPQVRKIVEQVATVSSSTFTVLILGETGTGKELVAQAVHRQSDRRLKPFVALDCGAIPDQLLESELFGHERGAFTGADRRKTGSFQLADGGTCFLDEVSNLPMSLQAKLLRVLESKVVQPVGATRPTRLDVRFLAATNIDLQARVAQGLFRADLYFRLAQYTIALPALRERPDDIAYLTHRFLEEARVELRRPVQELVPDAIDLLKQYRWPGNVRELRNVVRQAVLQSGDLVIEADVVRAVLGEELSATAPPPPSLTIGQSLRSIAEDAVHVAERQAITAALQETAGNKSQAAKALKTDYKTLHLKMKSLKIRAHDFKTN